jgi:GAF domain-containing protein
MSPAAPLPSDEQERIAALHELGILDTPTEERFDCLVRFVKQKLQMPIALISLVDTNRQWFKTCIGLPISETSRDASFCAYAILEEGILVIPDAAKDERFADNPLVTGPPFIRFYAGCPLREPQGHKIGTLCLIDRLPRQLDEQQLQRLMRIASIVEHQVYTTAALNPQRVISV